MPQSRQNPPPHAFHKVTEVSSAVGDVGKVWLAFIVLRITWSMTKSSLNGFEGDDGNGFLQIESGSEHANAQPTVRGSFIFLSVVVSRLLA